VASKTSGGPADSSSIRHRVGAAELSSIEIDGAIKTRLGKPTQLLSPSHRPTKAENAGSEHCGSQLK
jgi:hypothetical protein